MNVYITRGSSKLEWITLLEERRVKNKLSHEEQIKRMQDNKSRENLKKTDIATVRCMYTNTTDFYYIADYACGILNEKIDDGAVPSCSLNL
jgi:hypothetical protein